MRLAGLVRIQQVAALALTLALLGAPGHASAQDVKFFNASLFNPIQIVGEDSSIEGIRLSLVYGKNADVKGFDWSFIAAHTMGDFTGLQLAPVGLNEGAFEGVGAGFVSIARGQFTGAQLAFYSQVTNGKGLQWSGVSHVKGTFNGLQLGIVNYAQSIDGVQVGLINIIKEGGQFPFFPIVNWGK